MFGRPWAPPSVEKRGRERGREGGRDGGGERDRQIDRQTDTELTLRVFDCIFHEEEQATLKLAWVYPFSFSLLHT